MNWTELLQAALTLVVAFAFRWLLSVIGVELDEGIFAAIVGGIVVWLLGLFGVEVARAAKVRGIR
jgi:hypothetical protein